MTGHDEDCDLLHWGGPYEPDCGCKERKLISRTEELEAEVLYLRTIIEGIGKFLDRNDDAGVQLARQAVADLDRPDDT